MAFRKKKSCVWNSDYCPDSPSHWLCNLGKSFHFSDPLFVCKMGMKIIPFLTDSCGLKQVREAPHTHSRCSTNTTVISLLRAPVVGKSLSSPVAPMPPEVQDYSRICLHLLVYHKLLGSENRFKSTSDPLECLAQSRCSIKASWIKWKTNSKRRNSISLFANLPPASQPGACEHV